jgi:hypothetical protein
LCKDSDFSSIHDSSVKLDTFTTEELLEELEQVKDVIAGQKGSVRGIMCQFGVEGFVCGTCHIDHPLLQKNLIEVFHFGAQRWAGWLPASIIWWQAACPETAMVNH